MLTANDFIKKLNLTKHIEGGYFRRTYESKLKVSIPGYTGERHTATSIYFLLEKDTFSALHKLKSDEVWFFNYGSPLILYIINEVGELNKIILGDPNHPIYQFTVSANQWLAAEINDKSSFTLVSCFVSPGFEYNDFELADRDMLIQQYPNHANLIERLTRKK